jgi:RHS repeat-associated protein
VSEGIGSATGTPYRWLSLRADIPGVPTRSAIAWGGETGLVRMGPRVYSPALGRFLQPDPAHYADGPNLYAYARNSPLAYWDSTGLYAVAAAGLGAEAIKVLAPGGASSRAAYAAFQDGSYGAAAAHFGIGLAEAGLAVATLGYGQVVLQTTKTGTSVTATAAREVTIGAKVGSQLAQRGWTAPAIDDAVRNPARVVSTRDTRHLPGGGRMNDPATAYYSREGGYVVRNDRTGDIVQVSNRNDTGWRAPWD